MHLYNVVSIGRVGYRTNKTINRQPKAINCNAQYYVNMSRFYGFSLATP